MNIRRAYVVTAVVLLLIAYVTTARREGLDATPPPTGGMSDYLGGMASGASSYMAGPPPVPGQVPAPTGPAPKWSPETFYKTGDMAAIGDTTYVAKHDNDHMGTANPQFAIYWDVVKNPYVSATGQTMKSLNNVIGSTATVGMTVGVVLAIIFGGVLVLTFLYTRFFGGSSAPATIA